jgi:MFS transporter, PAT family, beta-lactamase induction signal transducer AmpG
MNGFIAKPDQPTPLRRAAALLLLGIASGLPLALSGDLLSAWLTDAGKDVSRIGSLGLVGLPYALKVLWSPLADRFALPFLGRRRGWMLISQIALMAAMFAMSATHPAVSLIPVAFVATAIAFLSATQDIVIDAWRADILPPEERGPGVAISVAGYRVGMIVTGAGSLLLVGHWNLSWPIVCRLCALAMSIGLLGTLIAPEPQTSAAPRRLADAVIRPLSGFLFRPGGILILLFVLIFKLPESLANAMSLPFLLKLGLSKTDIATARQGLGIAITIAGAMAGGLAVRRLGVWKSLWAFGFLHSVSNLAFLVLAETGPRYDVMLAVIAIENFCIGLATAAFTAWMIAQCDPRYSAFQYSLLSGVMALSRVLASPLAGSMAEHLGWPMFFFSSAMFGIPGMILLLWLNPNKQQTPATKPAWPADSCVPASGIRIS